jgi:hypothetical protein
MQSEEKISRQSREIDSTVDEESARDKRESCEIPGKQSEEDRANARRGGGNNCACGRLDEARAIPLYPP